MGEHSPFASPKPCPLLLNHPEAYEHLPNYGVYSLLYTPLHKPKVRNRAWKEGHQPVCSMQLVYMWKSSVPRNWRSICKYGLKSACRSSKDSTLNFLLETQKYIHSIRKPTIIEQRLSTALPTYREEPKTAKAAKEMKREEKKVGYSVKYFGDIDGEIGIRTRKVKTERLMTTKPLLTTSVSVETVHPPSPLAFSTPVSRSSPRMQVHIPQQVEFSTSLSPGQKSLPAFTFESRKGRPRTRQ